MKKGSLKKKIITIILSAVIFLLPVIALGSGLVAIWSFISGLAGSILGKSNTVDPDTVDISNYTLEKLIDSVDDKSVIPDKYLKELMIDRDSFKRLLVAINNYNTTYDEADKKIQYKHTYVTTSESKDEDGKVIIKRTKHVDYKYMKVHVSAEDLEGPYKIYWQPVFAALEENLMFNYYNLSQGGKSSSNSGGTSPSKSDVSKDDMDTVVEGNGDDVVAYAQKFIGNPYVYGGESLTNGCDCSGFVMKIYEHFGVSLPHHSGDIAKKGKCVCTGYDESKMKPGDVIYYADSTNSHVAIYIGNGYVIEALNAERGIIKNKAERLMPVVTVRRFLDDTNVKQTNKNKKAFKMKAETASASQMKAAKKEDKSENPYEGADKTLVGNTNDAKVWNYLKAKGYSDMVVSAIMGNLMQESGFNPREVYSGHYGLVQWGGGRWENLKKKYPGKEYDLLSQLDYMMYELTTSPVYGKVLTYMTHCDHLDYKNESDPGMVWFFARWYEICISSTGKYGVQDYDKRYAYAQQFLSKNGGKTGNIYDGIVVNAGGTGTGNAGVEYGKPAKLGTYDKKTGLVTLSDNDIQALLDDFRPKFDYVYDFVRDEKTKYTFKECKSMVNNGLESDGGNPDSLSGLKEWYMPTSVLTSVSLPYMDITYTDNVPTSYQLNMDRWKNTMSRYAEVYDNKWFSELIKLLPHGSDPITTYEYYLALSNGKIATDPSLGTSVGSASGNYAAMDNVVPSIKIPENAGGMSIPLYLQWDSRWGSVPFGGGNICSSGCSVTSLAMVVSYLNNQCIYPNDIVAFTGPTRYYVAGAGASYGIFKDVAAHWGIKCESGYGQTVNADAIRKALKANKPVIVSTTGYGTTQTFTKHGHFIVLRGLTSDGKVLVNDPNDNATTKQHYMKAYSAEFIVSECTENGTRKKPMWVFSK